MELIWLIYKKRITVHVMCTSECGEQQYSLSTLTDMALSLITPTWVVLGLLYLKIELLLC